MSRANSIPIKAASAEEVENVLKPTPSHFEKLYLSPEQAVAGKLRLTFANPAPIALGGFLLANTPATIMLMGWHGAGGGTGTANADTGAYFFLGATLLYFGGIGEWILGNTFPAVVFFTFGGFWGTFGATLTPFFDAVNGYGMATAGFYNSFAFFLLFMAVLCLACTILALRTNICLVVILTCFTVTFPCLTASYSYAADGSGPAATCRIVGAAFAFVASMVAWYLWFSILLDAVDFPFSLPVGNLTGIIKGRNDKLKKKEVEHMA
ncbi:GPR1/FUN34/YaaH-class plasma membrane protein [Teratosphaeria nubilosa]|uniref:GPR1/FUN34/YaaH-class plasma membrane protein n=1 Tax=Teratosphaeria nubilosa TaxID=161662 RepID=A0A6G1LL80_9PEZI|nr:GPR1/FUN34/YaaH-class plasma membrane protein [Teratosphaeria nubilosa]